MRRGAIALFATTSLAVGLAAGAPPAFADSHLDSENAILKKKVEKLESEVEALKAMVMKNNGAAMESPKAPEKMVTSGNPNVALSVSGQVNRLVLYADDGDQSRFFQADNDESSTRVRWSGSATFDDEFSVGALVEVQFESNSTADITIDQNKAVGTNSFTERKLEIFFKSKTAGKLSIGQGDTASNGSTEVDLSGTDVIALSDSSALAASMVFVLSDTRGTGSGATVGGAISNLDGLSRDDRLRYDTPSFAGAMLSASWVDGDEWDLAFRYGREFNGTEIALALAYWDASPTDQKEGYGGSASVLLPFGTNLTLEYSQEDLEAVGRDDPTHYYAKLGQQLDLIGLGTTALSIDYMVGEDQVANGDEADSYGFGIVQNIDQLATQLYGTIRQYDLDLGSGLATEPITIGAAGARVKF